MVLGVSQTPTCSQCGTAIDSLLIFLVATPMFRFTLFAEFEKRLSVSSSPSVVPYPSLPRSVIKERSLAAGSLEVAYFAIAALIVPELPPLLWYMQTHLAMQFRGWINSEYLLLLCVALLFPSWRMIAVLTFELTIALVEPIAHLYYLSPSLAIVSLKFLLLMPLHRIAEYGCLVICYAVGCATLLRISVGVRRRPMARKMAVATLVCALLPAMVDTALGRFKGVDTAHQSGDIDLHTSHAMRAPVASFFKAIVLGRLKPQDEPSEHLPSALGQAMGQLPTNTQPDIVLVLTESWGLAFDDRVNQAQMQPYRSQAIRDLYRVEIGTVPFKGATTSGETRELCGDSIGNASIDGPADFFAACWPARLASAGYHTVGTHGFTANMFNRRLWYQRFGFQQTAFLPDLERSGATVCDGPFPGACDADVARLVGDRLQTSRDHAPMFIHWVTLNSHLPIAPLADGTSMSECEAVGIDRLQSLCSWFKHVLVVHNSVAELATRHYLRPTVFVIVGDHAPPFMRSDLRGRFSQTNVPYVILMPRSIPPLETAALHPDLSRMP